MQRMDEHSGRVEGKTPAPSTSTEFETRCPSGKKVIQYKKAQLEKWSPYLNNNGLVCRLTTYEDLQCKSRWGAQNGGTTKCYAWQL